MPFFRKRFIELDPFQGYIRRYKKIEDFPNIPNEVISLSDISRCVKILEKSDSDNYFEFIIYCTSLERYKVYSLRACNRWVDVIDKGIQYHKFIKKILSKYPQAKAYFENCNKECVFLSAYNGSIKKIKFENGLLNIEEDPLSDAKKEKTNNISNSTNLLSNNQDTWNVSNKNTIPLNIQPTSIGSSSFDLLDILGSGSFGQVWKVRLKSTNEIYAMKMLNLKYLQKNKLMKFALSECNILKQLDHPYILKLHHSFQSSDNLYIILDYCPGGDLAYHLESYLFGEDEAKFYIAELILAIEYLHNNNIVYRDLKPENIFITEDGHIKLADFGYAKENIDPFSPSNALCFMTSYTSPEIQLRRGVGRSADLYDIGAILYEMISGTPPFYSEKLSELYPHTLQKNIMFPNYFSDYLKNLLKGLLSKDPKKRIGLHNKKQLMRHPFFNDIDWELLSKKELKPPLDFAKILNDSNKDNKSSDSSFNIDGKDNFKFVKK